MYPDSLYAQGRGSFLRPVPIPMHGPSALPTKTIDVSCEWLPYIRGALQQLLLQSTWATDNPAFLTDIQGNVSNLIDLFSECATTDLPFTCDYDYLSSDGTWVLTPHAGNIPAFNGEYIAGGGWFTTTSTDAAVSQEIRGVDIVKVFSPPVTLTHVKMTYDLVKGSFAFPGFNNGMYAYNATAELFQQIVASSTDADGPAKTIEWTGSVADVHALQIIGWTGDDYTITDPGGQMNVYRVEVSGIGPAGC